MKVIEYGKWEKKLMIYNTGGVINALTNKADNSLGQVARIASQHT